ncbi:MAG: hypothetical protein ABH863_02100 [Candidatus Micrarchaeota archaeon]
MAKKLRASAPVPDLPPEGGEIIDAIRILKGKNAELERRLNMVEEKLNDLSEQFLEEFGEDFQDEEK